MESNRLILIPYNPQYVKKTHLAKRLMAIGRFSVNLCEKCLIAVKRFLMHLHEKCLAIAKHFSV
jgi:hypothetical protein